MSDTASAVPGSVGEVGEGVSGKPPTAFETWLRSRLGDFPLTGDVGLKDAALMRLAWNAALAWAGKTGADAALRYYRCQGAAIMAAIFAGRARRPALPLEGDPVTPTPGLDPSVPAPAPCPAAVLPHETGLITSLPSIAVTGKVKFTQSGGLYFLSVDVQLTCGKDLTGPFYLRFPAGGQFLGRAFLVAGVMAQQAVNGEFTGSEEGCLGRIDCTIFAFQKDVVYDLKMSATFPVNP